MCFKPGVATASDVRDDPFWIGNLTPPDPGDAIQREKLLTESRRRRGQQGRQSTFITDQFRPPPAASAPESMVGSAVQAPVTAAPGNLTGGGPSPFNRRFGGS